MSSRTPSPVYGTPRAGKRPERFLLLCHYDPAGINAPEENIAYLQHFSQFNIEPLNLFHYPWRDGILGFRGFDGVIVHNTVSYHPASLEHLDAHLKTPFERYDGVKVLMKQDEQILTSRVATFVGAKRFDLVLTCLRPEDIRQAYPEQVVGNARFLRMHTGYVVPRLRTLKPPGNQTRPIDIFYRGSIQPLWFGRLAYEKRQIGYAVEPRARRLGLKVDISSRWEDRFTGDEWLARLSSAKATLGVESGSSIVDFDGSAERICREAEESDPGSPEDSDRCERILMRLSHLEDRLYYRTLSPRHFEAAATRTLQIMYEGDFEGVLLPGRHYVPLRRDLSNFDEVVDVLRDSQASGEIVNRTFAEIVLNTRYSIESFARDLDSHLSDLLASKGRAAQPIIRSAGSARHILLLCSHRPEQDPRISWVADHAPPGYLVHVLGISDAHQEAASVRSNGSLQLVAPRESVRPGSYSGMASALRHGMPGWSTLALLQILDGATDDELQQYIGAPPSVSPESMTRSLIRHFLRTNFTLIKAGLRFDGLHAIIAADLECLPAGAALKASFAAPLIYDAHEFWPDSSDLFGTSDIEFWKGIEGGLLPAVDAAFVVSPQLARHMSELYAVAFRSLPNCEPLGVPEPDPGVRTRAEYRPNLRANTCVFLFQGRLATGRGLSGIIDVWPETDPRAILVLRGPDCDYKDVLVEAARKAGLLNQRIFFLPPVGEKDLILAATAADVGLISYEPTSINNRFCCPNKLSQYMAAGLPILHNRLDFVGEIVAEAGCGIGFELGDRPGVVAAIDRLAADPPLRGAMGAKARQYFSSKFHWQRVSQVLYEQIDSLASYRPARECHLYAAPQLLIEVPSKARLGTFRSARALWSAMPAEARSRFHPVARAVKRILRP
jgi:glycosyltransferase involved in cell wall biosynthesis